MRSVGMGGGFEKLASTADAGFDRADGGGFDLGGFEVGEFFESDEGEGALLLVGELVKSAVEGGKLVATSWVGRLRGGFWNLCDESWSFLVERIDGAAATDHEKPGGEATASGIEVLEATEGFDEDVLRNVFCHAPVVVENSRDHSQ